MFSRSTESVEPTINVSPIKCEIPPQLLSIGESRITLRLLNTASPQDAKRVIKLFLRQYGREYPFQDLYDPDFWFFDSAVDKSRSFISFVAEVGDKFIAHLAIRPGDSSASAEILFPALDPEFNKQLPKLGAYFFEQMRLFAQTQEWEMFYYYNVPSRMAQYVACESFHSLEAAFVPNDNLPHNRGTSRFLRHRGRTLLLMCNRFGSFSNNKRKIFPPLKHSEFIAELFLPFGHRELYPEASVENGPVQWDSKRQLSAERAMRTQSTGGLFTLKSHETFSITWVTLNPSDLSQELQAVDYLSWLEQDLSRRNRRLLIKVVLNDPACPRICELLERSGYSFCGVLPAGQGADLILYCRLSTTDLMELRLYTKRANKLRDYLLNNASISALPAG